MGEASEDLEAIKPAAGSAPLAHRRAVGAGKDDPEPSWLDPMQQNSLLHCKTITAEESSRLMPGFLAPRPRAQLWPAEATGECQAIEP